MSEKPHAMRHSYELRSATTGDRIFVESIYFKTQRSIIETLFGRRGDDVERGKFAEFYDLPNTTIIMHQGDDVGWMTIVRHREYIELEHLYLDEAYQGRGIGSAILCGLIQEADGLGLPIRLSAAKVNRARRLFERLGFVEAGTDQFKIYMERRPGRSTTTGACEGA